MLDAQQKDYDEVIWLHTHTVDVLSHVAALPTYLKAFSDIKA